MTDDGVYQLAVFFVSSILSYHAHVLCELFFYFEKIISKPIPATRVYFYQHDIRTRKKMTFVEKMSTQLMPRIHHKCRNGSKRVEEKKKFFFFRTSNKFLLALLIDTFDHMNHLINIVIARNLANQLG